MADDITPSQLAIMEAARAVWSLIGEEHVENFAVVGGAALLFYGLNVRTNDVDIAINADSLYAFAEAAQGDPRFTWTVGMWEYRPSEGFTVQIDFLENDGSGGYLHRLQGCSLLDGVPLRPPPKGKTNMKTVLCKLQKWGNRYHQQTSRNTREF